MLNDAELKALSGAFRAMYPEQIGRLRDGDKGKYEKYKNDPAGYIRRVLRRELTPKQEEICQKMLVYPHRVIGISANNQGKCIGFDEPITLADGSQRKAGDLIGKTFMMPTLVDGKVVARKAKAELNRFEDVYELETDFGVKIVRNGHHPIRACLGRFKAGSTPRLGDDDWVKMADMLSAPEDHTWVLAVSDQFSVEGVDVLTDDEVKITAYLTGDGCLRSLTPVFTQMPGKQLDEFKQCCANVGARTNLGNNKTIEHSVIGPDRRKGSNPVTNLMNRLGLMGKNSHTKFVPNEIMSASLRQQAIYLSRLYSTDGWASTLWDGSCSQIGYCSVSEVMIRQIQQMLVRHGVHARLNFKKKVKAWQLVVQNNSDIIRFVDRIGIFGKEDAVQVAYDRCKSRPKDRCGWMRRDNIPGTQWQKVRSVKRIGQQWTVAIEVEETHTFLSPIYEHNTWLIGALINWFYDCFNPGVCISTGPTDQHVKNVIWKEVRSQRKTRWDFAGDRMPELRDAANHYALGYTGNKVENFQGLHDDHLFFIIDEAIGVGEHVFRGMKSMFKPNGRHFWLTMLNPTDTTVPVYAEEQSGDYHTVRMSALEHPNIVAELRGDDLVIPGAVEVAMLNTWFRDWFEEVHPDDYRPGDVIWPPDWSKEYGALERFGKQRVLRPSADGQSRVLGIWPTASEWAVWSDHAWLSACRRLDGQKPIPLTWAVLPRLGCDVSRGGGDKTEVIAQCDNIALEHRVGSSWDVPRTISELIKYAEKYCKLYNENRPKSEPLATPQQIVMNIDDDGVGGGVTDMLKSHGYNAIGIGAGSVAEKPHKYPLMRDQLWFETVMAAKADDIDISRLPDKSLIEMKRQAMAVRFENDHRGRRFVWHKDKTRKVIGRSPDSMDALNLAFCHAGGSSDAPTILKR